MILRIAIVCVLLCSVSHADDIYLKTGFVFRNVQVIDTTNGRINIKRDGQITVIDTAYVLKIDNLDLLPGQKSTYEIFSRDLYDQYLKRKEQMEASRMAARTDSLQRIEEHLDSTYSWCRSAYVAGGWGIPQGARFELGYNFGESVALALSFGRGDNWSSDPAEGTLAGLVIVRFPMSSLSITPYLLFCRGGTLTIFGGPDVYTLVYLGTMIELRSGIHLRPECGVALTSRHVSGGTSLLGGTSPEVTEDRSTFGMNITLEIDFAHAF